MTALQRTVGFLLLSFILFAGVADAQETVQNADEQELHQLVKRQQVAVQTGDKAAFLATIHEENRLYYAEQAHWFDDLLENPVQHFTRRISSIEEVTSEQAVVWVEQRYRDHHGEHRMLAPIRWLKMGEEWKDDGLLFDVLSDGRITVKFTHPEMKGLAKELLLMGSQIVHVFGQKYGWQPLFPVEIKLYGNEEWFRQSVKLSLPRWAGGWQEYGEAIKFICNGNGAFVRHALIHELSHKMLGEMTHDNAAYWLQEGLAEHYQWEWNGNRHQQRLRLSPEQAYSFEQMTELNLETLAEEEAARYYLQAWSMVTFLLDTYGESRMKRLMLELQNYPYAPLTAAQKLEQSSQRTEQALKKVYQLDMQALEREWRQWLQYTG